MSVASLSISIILTLQVLAAAATLPDVAHAQEAEPRACTMSESAKRIRWNDLPFERTDAYLCSETPLTPDDSGLVNCRVFWKLPSSPGTNGRPSACSDYSFLTPSTFDPFAALDGRTGPGEVCLVRQVTRSAADEGKAGWYYLASAPTRCPNLAPALMLPSDRPDNIDIYAQCAMTKTIVGRGQVVEANPASCVQPRVAADPTHVGSVCEVAMTLSKRHYNLDLGNDGCLSAVCLQTPLREQVCSETDGIRRCSGSTTSCSCRCAGAEGDPGPFCVCPDDYECKPLVSDFAGTKDSRGSYCVSTGALIR